MATIAEATAPRQPRRRQGTATVGRLQTGPLVTAHMWVAIAAFAVACLLTATIFGHLAGALWHHFVAKDRVLRRMLGGG